ncbi:hypothetical protein [Turicibacter bilis]
MFISDEDCIKIQTLFKTEEMLANGYNFGGEQSGHLIFLC